MIKNEELDDELLLEEDEDEDTLKDMYLIFRLAQEEYGLEIRYVIDIVGMQRITDVPDMPGFVRGVINLRGQVIPVMDVRRRFKLEPREYTERTCIIVLQIGDVKVGLIVDAVSEVYKIPPAQISLPPQIKKNARSRYLMGMGRVGEEVKILLDVNKLLFDEELEQLQNCRE